MFVLTPSGPSSLSRDGAKAASHRRYKAFAFDPTAVTNDQFKRFVRATGFKTEAETYQWSFVLELLASEATEAPTRGGLISYFFCRVACSQSSPSAGRALQ